MKERKPVSSTDLKVLVFYLYVWTYVGICCAVHGKIRVYVDCVDVRNA